MSESKVYSVTIKGKNDCVVMTEEEAMLVKIKYMPDIEIYDMTERHGMKPEHLHKLSRMDDAERFGPNITYMGKEEPVIKGVGIGSFGGASNKVIWDFDDLMAGIEC